MTAKPIAGLFLVWLLLNTTTALALSARFQGEVNPAPVDFSQAAELATAGNALNQRIHLLNRRIEQVQLKIDYPSTGTNLTADAKELLGLQAELRRLEPNVRALEQQSRVFIANEGTPNRGVLIENLRALQQSFPSAPGPDGSAGLADDPVGLELLNEYKAAMDEMARLRDRFVELHARVNDAPDALARVELELQAEAARAKMDLQFQKCVDAGRAIGKTQSTVATEARVSATTQLVRAADVPAMVGARDDALVEAGRARADVRSNLNAYEAELARAGMSDADIEALRAGARPPTSGESTVLAKIEVHQKAIVARSEDFSRFVEHVRIANARLGILSPIDHATLQQMMSDPDFFEKFIRPAAQRPQMDPSRLLPAPPAEIGPVSPVEPIVSANTTPRADASIAFADEGAVDKLSAEIGKMERQREWLNRRLESARQNLSPEKVAELEARVRETQTRIDELNRQLPEARSADAAREINARINAADRRIVELENQLRETGAQNQQLRADIEAHRRALDEYRAQMENQLKRLNAARDPEAVPKGRSQSVDAVPDAVVETLSPEARVGVDAAKAGRGGGQRITYNITINNTEGGIVQVVKNGTPVATVNSNPAGSGGTVEPVASGSSARPPTTGTTSGSSGTPSGGAPSGGSEPVVPVPAGENPLGRIEPLAPVDPLPAVSSHEAPHAEVATGAGPRETVAQSRLERFSRDVLYPFKAVIQYAGQTRVVRFVKWVSTPVRVPASWTLRTISYPVRATYSRLPARLQSSVQSLGKLLLVYWAVAEGTNLLCQIGLWCDADPPRSTSPPIVSFVRDPEKIRQLDRIDQFFVRLPAKDSANDLQDIFINVDAQNNIHAHDWARVREKLKADLIDKLEAEGKSAHFNTEVVGYKIASLLEGGSMVKQFTDAVDNIDNGNEPLIEGVDGVFFVEENGAWKPVSPVDEPWHAVFDTSTRTYQFQQALPNANNRPIRYMLLVRFHPYLLTTGIADEQFRESWKNNFLRLCEGAKNGDCPMLKAYADQFVVSADGKTAAGAHFEELEKQVDGQTEFWKTWSDAYAGWWASVKDQGGRSKDDFYDAFRWDSPYSGIENRLSKFGWGVYNGAKGIVWTGAVGIVGATIGGGVDATAKNLGILGVDSARSRMKARLNELYRNEYWRNAVTFGVPIVGTIGDAGSAELLLPAGSIETMALKGLVLQVGAEDKAYLNRAGLNVEDVQSAARVRLNGSVVPLQALMQNGRAYFFVPNAKTGDALEFDFSFVNNAGRALKTQKAFRMAQSSVITDHWFRDLAPDAPRSNLPSVDCERVVDCLARADAQWVNELVKSSARAP